MSAYLYGGTLTTLITPTSYSHRLIHDYTGVHQKRSWRSFMSDIWFLKFCTFICHTMSHKSYTQTEEKLYILLSSLWQVDNINSIDNIEHFPPLATMIALFLSTIASQHLPVMSKCHVDTNTEMETIQLCKKNLTLLNGIICFT